MYYTFFIKILFFKAVTKGIVFCRFKAEIIFVNILNIDKNIFSLKSAENKDIQPQSEKQNSYEKECKTSSRQSGFLASLRGFKPDVTHTLSSCRIVIKPGFHMIVRIVRIVPIVPVVSKKTVQTTGTIIWKRYPGDRKRPGRFKIYTIAPIVRIELNSVQAIEVVSVVRVVCDQLGSVSI